MKTDSFTFNTAGNQRLERRFNIWLQPQNKQRQFACYYIISVWFWNLGVALAV
jgi:hypothetical protein